MTLEKSNIDNKAEKYKEMVLTPEQERRGYFEIIDDIIYHRMYNIFSRDKNGNAIARIKVE